jgi:hypothetical protein
MESTSPWLLVGVALLLIGLTKISFVKNGFDRLGRDQSPKPRKPYGGNQFAEIIRRSIFVCFLSLFERAGLNLPPFEINCS